MIRILTVASLCSQRSRSCAADMQESRREGGLLSGGWSLTLGASGYFAPEYEGDDKMVFMAVPLVSLGRTDTITKFSSRNDNISLGLIDNGTVRAGIAGKILFGRDEDDSDDLIGLDPVRWGGELGLFAEVYPTDWLRLRGELRHGIRTTTLVGASRPTPLRCHTDHPRVGRTPRLLRSEDISTLYWGKRSRIGSPARRLIRTAAG